jgi:excisionase family DNA binding protein
MNSIDKLLPVHIVAKRLGCSKDTVYRLINAGELIAANTCTRGQYARRNRWKVFEESVNNFVKKNTVE